jgi:hypothetical protein
VAFVRTDVSEKSIVSIIRVTRIGELGKTLAVTELLVPDDVHGSLIGGNTFLRNVGSYNNHLMSYGRRRHSSEENW